MVFLSGWVHVSSGDDDSHVIKGNDLRYKKGVYSLKFMLFYERLMTDHERQGPDRQSPFVLFNRRCSTFMKNSLCNAVCFVREQTRWWLICIKIWMNWKRMVGSSYCWVKGRFPRLSRPLKGDDWLKWLIVTCFSYLKSNLNIPSQFQPFTPKKHE